MSKPLLLMCLLHGFAAQSLTVDELVRVAVLAALRDWAGETVLLAGCMVCHHVGCCVLLRLCCIAAYCACCCMLLLVLWSWWCRRSGVACASRCAWRVAWTLARCWVVAPEGARRGSKAVCVSHFYLLVFFLSANSNAFANGEGVSNCETRVSVSGSAVQLSQFDTNNLP